MGDARPIMRPSDIRRAVSEWAAQGFSVTVDPDGRIHVEPPSTMQKPDSFDQIDFKR